MWEVPYYPAYYVPLGDVAAELAPTGKTEHSPSRGDAELYDVHVDGAVAEGAARRYPDSPLPAIRDLVRFEWSAMGEWLEEDEPVYTHPRDPYHRVDILASSRHVRVEVDGTTVAESARPVILFETGLPPRYYLPLPDVRTDLLAPSGTQTHCPYKGMATYSVGGHRSTARCTLTFRVGVPRSPGGKPEDQPALACFYDEKTDVYLDGQLQAAPPHAPSPDPAAS